MSQLSPEIIAAAPEGATYSTLAGTYWKPEADGWWSAMSRGKWKRAADPKHWALYLQRGQVLPLPATPKPEPEAEWRTGVPTVRGVYVVSWRSSSGGWFEVNSYFDGANFLNTAADDPSDLAEVRRYDIEHGATSNSVERWRLIEADPTLQTPAAALIRKPAHKEPERYLGRGDAAGIEAFVIPELPAPKQEKVRVSTLRRAWLWL